MKSLTEQLSDILGRAFESAGYDPTYAAVRYSDRPDLCEFQCNGAMAAAKAYHKAPFMIADDVLAAIPENDLIGRIEVVKPGFINIDCADSALADLLKAIGEDENLSIPQAEKADTVVIDYGGPNVAKPLHVGHLRSAVIGECIKRLKRAVGHEVLGDVHLGDWGLQMGLIITEMKERQPELPYFDESFTGEYPAEAPFTISELEEIYPTASGKSKADEAYKAKALDATYQLQIGNRGYRALWNKIMEVSIADLKRNYSNLNVDFDLWKAESDAQPYIPAMIEDMKAQGILHESEGAMVIDVMEDTDTKEIPPCIIQKSDGASLYATTDLATLVEREKLFKPDEVLYVVDKRQEMHFTQVFRSARKAGIVRPETRLKFLGFGTMNGRDGKPFKTRDGGVMRLEMLLNDIYAEMEKKISENRNVKEEDAAATAKIVGLSAVKYGDLSNQATKDYIFDVDKFTSFEGNTGPYILYTIVRIKSILEKNDGPVGPIISAASPAEKSLMLKLARFGTVIDEAAAELAPHKICAYIYSTANDFNRFYHDTRILTEENAAQKASWIGLLELTKRILEKSIDILGFSAPEHM
ncbi:MAG: arginine--tRNA ligase [Lachnospiraceae bacterium]|nr:arginine--tRNA ligase [Lachnospiraceae bacterium]